MNETYYVQADFHLSFSLTHTLTHTHIENNPKKSERKLVFATTTKIDSKLT